MNTFIHHDTYNTYSKIKKKKERKNMAKTSSKSWTQIIFDTTTLCLRHCWNGVGREGKQVEEKVGKGEGAGMQAEGKAWGYTWPAAP